MLAGWFRNASRESDWPSYEKKMVVDEQVILSGAKVAEFYNLK
jgi:hypothetical protein